MGKNQHIVKRPNGWAVIGAGNEKATKIVKKQEDAIEIGKQIAQNQHSELFVHDKNGKIRKRDSFGSDPYPPRN